MGQMINGKIVTLSRCQPPRLSGKRALGRKCQDARVLQRLCQEPTADSPPEQQGPCGVRIVLLSNGDRVG